MEYLGQLTRDKWVNIAKQDPDATFFHTPHFADILQADDKIHSTYALGWKHESGYIALPIYKCRPTFRSYFSVPKFANIWSSGEGTYGGIITSTNNISASSKTIYNSLNSNINEIGMAIQVNENPFANNMGDLPVAWNVETDFTQFIDLNKSYSEIHEGFRGGRQRNINTAKDHGVTVRKAADYSDVDGYLECYSDSLDRWDNPTSVYTEKLFKKIWELCQSSENVSIWVAEVGGQVASGATVFEWNGHVDYWHGAADSDYFDYRPNDILHAKIIEDAVNRGKDIYDFNPSGGHEGVVKFKSGFGPERASFRRGTSTNRIWEIGQLINNRLSG